MPDQLQPTRHTAAAARVDLAAQQPLTDDEARYLNAARAANTLRGYGSDWREFSAWCADHAFDSLPATAAAISTYLTTPGQLSVEPLITGLPVGPTPA